MNIFVIALLSAAVNPALTCTQNAGNGAEFQTVAAVEQTTDGVPGAAVIDPGGVVTPLHATSGPGAMVEDLEFYFSSHAQAVTDTPGPTMTPWLELRPFGDSLQRVLSGTEDQAQEPSNNRKNACTWSFGGSAASEQLLVLSAV